MEHRAGFEPAVLLFCRQLPWTTRPSMHCLAYREGFEPSQADLEAAVLPLTLPIHKMVLPLGFEPRSSPHLEASPEYKAGALPLSYGSKNLERVARIELANSPWQGLRLPLHHTRKLYGTP